MQVHVQASSDASRSRPADPWIDLRRELMDWAEPVIADCIYEGYRGQAMEAGRARLLSSQHRRLWRAMLLEHRSTMNSVWTDLNSDLDAAGMEPTVARAIDQSVFEELLDIVMRRFRASSDKAKGCSMILLGAATYIGASAAMQ